jgi:hypothetical protein
MTRVDRLLAIGCALVASAALLVLYPNTPAPPPPAPVPVAQAWPHAPETGVRTSLADGTTYQPVAFLTAAVSVGTAPSPDHRSLRLLEVGAGSVKVLRSLPASTQPWFGSFATSGDALVWAEDSSGSRRLWTVSLRAPASPRQLTTQTGAAILNGTPYDLVIADGRVYWAAADPQRPDLTEIRSVALTGGPVDVRQETGSWTLSSWPWLVNGSGDTAGTTDLLNMVTDRDVAIGIAGDRETAHCDPTWCLVVSLSADGYRVEVVHPDGTARRTVTTGQIAPELGDLVALGRYIVLAQVSSYTDLTGTRSVLVYDLSTQRMVQLSSGARTVAYSNGVLWWSTGTRDAPVWHAIDLTLA